MVDTGGGQRHPGSTARLKLYWTRGKGAAAIRWGTPGDHTRCVRLIQEAITKDGRPPLPDHEIHGLCTNLQQEAIGTSGNAGEGGKGHR